MLWFGHGQWQKPKLVGKRIWGGWRCFIKLAKVCARDRCNQSGRAGAEVQRPSPSPLSTEKLDGTDGGGVPRAGSLLLLTGAVLVTSWPCQQGQEAATTPDPVPGASSGTVPVRPARRPRNSGGLGSRVDAPRLGFLCRHQLACLPRTSCDNEGQNGFPAGDDRDPMMNHSQQSCVLAGA